MVYKGHYRESLRVLFHKINLRGNILTYISAIFWHDIVGVLIDNALGLLFEIVDGFLSPPLFEVAVFVVLPSCEAKQPKNKDPTATET